MSLNVLLFFAEEKGVLQAKIHEFLGNLLLLQVYFHLEQVCTFQFIPQI